MPLGVLKTLEGERYVAIKAYNFTIFEIFVLYMLHVCTCTW